MVNSGEKAKIKKAGNLNSCRSYVITTVSAQIRWAMPPPPAPPGSDSPAVVVG